METAPIISKTCQRVHADARVPGDYDLKEKCRIIHYTILHIFGNASMRKNEGHHHQISHIFKMHPDDSSVF
jgi:hypothetical protein